MAGTWLERAGLEYGIFFTLTIALASIAAKAALTAQREIVNELHNTQEELRWDVTRVQQIQWHQQQVCARALHGPVQSAIIVETMHLTQGDSEDVATVEGFRSRLIFALRHAVAESGGAPSVHQMLTALSRTWASLCDVTFTASSGAGAVDGDPVSRSCLSDILSEAVANAVRHGYARSVGIDLSCQTSRVLSVTVRDDGCSRDTADGVGLGSQMLDDCCLDWDRSSGETGTVLNFRLPFAPDTAAVVGGNASQTVGAHR